MSSFGMHDAEGLRELLKQVVRVGVVTSTDPAAATARVRCADADNLVTWPLRVLNHKTCADKSYWMPDVGDQVLCLFLPLGPEQGFVVGAFYSSADQPPVRDQDKHHVLYKDGTWLEYDRKEHKLHGVIKGDVELVVEGAATLEVKQTLDAVVHESATIDSKQTLHLKGQAAVMVHTANFQIVSYDGGGGTTATLEADILQRGRFEQEGDYLQTGDQVQVGQRHQVGDQEVEGELKADLLRGPLAE